MGSSNTDQIQDYSQCNLIELTSPLLAPCQTHLLLLPPKNGCCVTTERSSGTNDCTVLQCNKIIYSKIAKEQGGRKLTCLHACSAPIEVLIFVQIISIDYGTCTSSKGLREPTSKPSDEKKQHLQDCEQANYYNCCNCNSGFGDFGDRAWSTPRCGTSKVKRQAILISQLIVPFFKIRRVISIKALAYKHNRFLLFKEILIRFLEARAVQRGVSGLSFSLVVDGSLLISYRVVTLHIK